MNDERNRPELDMISIVPSQDPDGQTRPQMTAETKDADTSQEPELDKSPSEEPHASHPAAGKTGTQKNGAKKPGAGKRKTASGKTGSQKPGAGKPGVGKSKTASGKTSDTAKPEIKKSDPGRNKAGAGKPGTSKSGAKKPGAGKSKTAAGKTARSETGSRKSKSTGAQTTGKSGKKTSGKSAASKNKRFQRPPVSYIHIGIISAILLIGIIGVIRLSIWNRGQESDYDPNEDTSEFDVESEDYIVAADSEMLAQQADDGVTTILLLGNDSLAETRGQADSIGMQVEEMTGGKVYDASLKNTYLSVKNATYDESYQADVFSLYWMVYCITAQDFTLLEDNARSWDGDEDVAEIVDMLKTLDMSQVDVITIMYDYHDYEDKRLLVGPYDDTIAASCCGCLWQSVNLIQQTYPHIRVIVSSPYFACVQDENGEIQPGSILNLGQGTLAAYMIAYKNIATATAVSFIDHYLGTINEDNYEAYLEEDKAHLNAEGRKIIARRIADFIGS